MNRPPERRWHDDLSALLDGELDHSAAEALRRRVDADETLAAELIWVRQARDLVAGTPVVTSDLGSVLTAVAQLDELDHRRRRRLGAVASVGVAAAVWVVVAVGFTGTGLPDGTPSVASLVAAHETPQPGPTLVSAALDQQYVAPEQVVGVGLADLKWRGDQLQAVYRGAASPTISVFQVRGRVDWDALPAAGRRVVVADHPAWQLVGDEVTVLVVQRVEMVHTFVADRGAHLDVLATALPEPPHDDPPWWKDLLGLG